MPVERPLSRPHNRPNRAFDFVSLAALPLLAVILVVATIASRGADHPPQSDPPGHDLVLGHVHGLGVDPADGVLYAASHLGVFRMSDDARPERVADRWQDTMGFTVVGPGHFLASGHPDLTENLPTHLGLIESRDAAMTWQPLALSGEADFHALEASGGRTWGYDSQSGTLMTSTDNLDWHRIAASPLIDVAADPTDRDRILATAPNGGLHSFTAAGAHELMGTPGLTFVDWPRDDLLVGATVDGRILRSADEGKTWKRAATEVPGGVEALDVDDTGWYVATSAGIFSSKNEGRTWLQLFAHSE